MNIETIKARLRGTSPLIMHNARLADPTDPLTIELAKLTSSRNKTIQNLAETADLEWLGAMYEYDGKPVIFSDMLLGCLHNGINQVNVKLSKKFLAGVVTEKDFFPLHYEPHKTIEEMRHDSNFRMKAMVAIGSGKQRKRVLRTRPYFRTWGLEIELTVFPDVINTEAVVRALHAAGRLVGMGDWRPRYGRFQVEVL